MPQNINRAHCTVLRPDQFKFASYGPVIPHLLTATGLSTVQLGLDTINHSADRFQYSAQGTYTRSDLRWAGLVGLPCETSEQNTAIGKHSSFHESAYYHTTSQLYVHTLCMHVLACACMPVL